MEKESKLTQGKFFNEHLWVVSVVNTGSKFLGHTKIIVEGLKNNSSPTLFNLELFVGEYDFLAEAFLDQDTGTLESKNRKGFISAIRCFEKKEYYKPERYQKYTVYSEEVAAKSVKKMIENIQSEKQKFQQILATAIEEIKDLDSKTKEIIYDHEKIKKLIATGHAYLKYQFVGSNHFLLGSKDKGINCAEWCLQKLAIAGMGNGKSIAKPEKVAGGFVCSIQ